MNTIFWLARSPMIYFFISSLLSSLSAEQPFVFNPHTLKIYNLPNKLEISPEVPYAVACPAQIHEELKMNRKISMDHEALFIHEFFLSVKRPLDRLTCVSSFKMAAVYNRENDHIEFGYEVYVKKARENDVNTTLFAYYGPISESNSTLLESANFWFKRAAYPSLNYYKSESTLRFVWISRIKLQYDGSRWSFISTKYTLYRNKAQELKIECDNHDLGHRFYGEEHQIFDDFYSPDNQKKIFSVVKLPELPENSVCKQTFECVKKYDFLKPYHFRSSYESPISCSNLTTIPIWYEVAEDLLNNLEIYLFALGKITQNQLTILPGVYGTLYLSTKTQNPKPKAMYLHSKRNKIPIPRILYKIVRYKSHDCNVKQELCWFGIVIVIQNHPGPVKKRRICPKDKCKEYGWEKIKFVNTPEGEKQSEYIYCCKLDKDMQKKLNYDVGKVIHDDLNLKDFPVYDDEEEDNRYVDRRKEIEDQIKKDEREADPEVKRQKKIEKRRILGK